MSNAKLIEKITDIQAKFVFDDFDEADETEVNTALNTLESAITALEHADRMREALQEFVNRCDRGEVSSRYTYSKFKFLLEKDND